MLSTNLSFQLLYVVVHNQCHFIANVINIYMQNIDYGLLQWFIFDVDSANRPLHSVNVGSIVDVSEVHAAPTFRIVISRVSVHVYKGFGPTDPLAGSQ